MVRIREQPERRELEHSERVVGVDSSVVRWVVAVGSADPVVLAHVGPNNCMCEVVLGEDGGARLFRIVEAVGRLVGDREEQGPIEQEEHTKPQGLVLSDGYDIQQILVLGLCQERCCEPLVQVHRLSTWLDLQVWEWEE